MKIVVITGANTGIGYETVKALLQSTTEYHIFLGSRSVEKGEVAKKQLFQEVASTKSTIDVLQVDLSSDESIKTALAIVQKQTDHIDALVNNAGHAMDAKIDSGELTRRQVWNQDYDINVSGTEVMTYAFVPLLIKSTEPRLLFLTSGLASLGRMSEAFYSGNAPTATGWPKTYFGAPLAYRSSKTALNMLMLSWHHILLPDGVKTFSISPGFLSTGLGGLPPGFLDSRGAGHPSLGGQLIQQVVAGERDADAGKIVNAEGVMPF